MISFRKTIGILSNRLFYFLLAVMLLPACDGPVEVINPTIPESAILTTLILPTSTTVPATPTLLPTNTATPGPSPTSTPLPPLEENTWRAKPMMVEWASIANDPLDPFRYTPFLILYGDGLIVKRSCQDDGRLDCRYLQKQLDEVELCRWINAIDRTGFLDANPLAVQVPGGTGTEIRLAVQVYAENGVQIPDLDRWAESPNWYGEFTGCPACFEPPAIDPAFIGLYRLLSTYPDEELSGLNTERLAVWLTKPVVTGAARAWNDDEVSLAAVAEWSACPDDPARQQAVVLEGSMARQVSDFLSSQGNLTPLFTENGQTWQVHSRWLLPYEMPQTCQAPAGLYPPSDMPNIVWQCEPTMGAIPTSTSTITPTPSVTPTPLR